MKIRLEFMDSEYKFKFVTALTLTILHPSLGWIKNLKRDYHATNLFPFIYFYLIVGNKGIAKGGSLNYTDCIARNGQILEVIWGYL